MEEEDEDEGLRREGKECGKSDVDVEEDDEEEEVGENSLESKSRKGRGRSRGRKSLYFISLWMMRGIVEGGRPETTCEEWSVGKVDKKENIRLD